LIASYEFAFSIEVSDVCAAPNQAILQAANRTTNFNNETWEIAEYYLYCDSSHANNPLITQTTEAYNNLSSVQSLVIYLNQTASEYGIQQQASILTADYTNILNDLLVLNESLNCDVIHNVYYVNIENDTCHDLINEWFVLYLFQFAIIILIIIRSWFICSQKPNNPPEVSNTLKSYPSYYTKEGTNIESGNNQNIQYGMLVDDVVLNDTSFGRGSSLTSQSTYTDDDVQECVHYLTAFEDENERKKQAEILKQVGYRNKKNPRPLNSDMVFKAMAIIRNRQSTIDSKYKHPLFQ